MSERATAARVFAAALGGESCRVHGLTDRPIPLRMDRWRQAANASDRRLLDRCTGTTIDVGCGPGRLTFELLSRGVSALGIDAVDAAVQLARQRGAFALRRDVFGPVPGEGRWQSALLADGNIGIGGDPLRLLRRVRELISPTGRIVVDVSARGTEIIVKEIALACGPLLSHPFMWAVVPASCLAELAALASLSVLELTHTGDRTFGVLVPVAAR